MDRDPMVVVILLLLMLACLVALVFAAY